MLKIGIDVGGTFTDLVAVDDSGHSTLAKVASTPEDPSIGVMAGLDRLAEFLRLSPSQLLAQTERIVHGTTVATNALLEHKGAKVGLLTTEGHRDVIEMREGLKDDRYNLRMPPPEQLVPRALRLGVTERMRADGTIETPLDRTSLADIDRDAEASRRGGGGGVLSARLSRSAPRTRDRRGARPGDAGCVRVAVVRRVPADQGIRSRLHDGGQRLCRTGAVALSAPAGTAAGRGGLSGPILIIQSHGGVAPIAEAARLAAGGVLSGPAGGVAGSRYATQLLGSDNLIPFDMGGTSTDICLIVDGEPALVSGRGIGGHRLALNSLDIVSLGAGGGSIGRVDAGGILHVGPQSAGAVPGPACYGRGGTEPTVTDANLVLGYLDPDALPGRQREARCSGRRTARWIGWRRA